MQPVAMALRRLSQIMATTSALLFLVALLHSVSLS